MHCLVLNTKVGPRFDEPDQQDRMNRKQNQARAPNLYKDLLSEEFEQVRL